MRVYLLVLLLVICLTEQSLLIKERPRHRVVRMGVSQESDESDDSDEVADGRGSERHSRPSRRHNRVIVLEHTKKPEPTTKKPEPTAKKQEPTTGKPHKCKRHYSLNKGQVDWYTAKQRCLANHQQLVSIENVNKIIEMVEAVGELSGWVWTSGKKREDGIWIWESTGKMMKFVINWATGEPNNLGPHGEGCMNLYPSYRFNDLNCNLKYPYICQNEVCI